MSSSMCYVQKCCFCPAWEIDVCKFLIQADSNQICLYRKIYMY